MKLRVEREKIGWGAATTTTTTTTKRVY